MLAQLIKLLVHIRQIQSIIDLPNPTLIPYPGWKEQYCIKIKTGGKIILFNIIIFEMRTLRLSPEYELNQLKTNLFPIKH